MLKIFKNKIKITIICVLLCAICMTVGCSTDNNTNNTTVENKNNEKEEDLITTISKILKCNDDTAQSVYEIIAEHTDGNIVKISKESENARIRIEIVDDLENVYIAVIGTGYVVDSIYRDSEDGERIYRIIE